MRGCISKRGGKWAFVVEYGKHPVTGKRRQKSRSGFGTKAEAERELAKVMHELGTGTYIEPTKDDVTTYFTSWLKQKQMQIRPGTYKTYRWLVNYHIIPQLGPHKLEKLTPQHLVDMYGRLQNGEKRLSAQTINHVHKVLHDALEIAVKWEMLNKNVARLVKPPKIPKPVTNVWTEEELVQFLTFTKSSRYHIIFQLAATTGMRRGEVLGVKWDDIDLVIGRLSVRRSYTRGLVGHIFQEPKTAAGKRSIILPKQTIEALQKQRIIIEADKQKAGANYQDHGLVVQTRMVSLLVLIT